MKSLERLQRALGYRFRDPTLLELALTHRSAGKRNNERLEFLGDSIVNHIIAEALFSRFPSVREGSLSRMRAALVKGDTLADIARQLELGAFLSLGPGERKSGGQRRDSILADALEAIAGAILLDGGVDACRDCLLEWYGARLEELTEESDRKDAKTRLQEYLQGRGQPLPKYALLDVSGEDHDQYFRVSCTIKSADLTTEGEGISRRKAEQAAARSALVKLSHDG
ncbi:ribonuclease III [Halieaceae bacterium]|nr:ribonuclease III [Halieaceae bacterium]